MKQHFLESANGKIFYQKGGAGLPLLFLHGNGEDSSIFKRQLEDFKANYTLLAMDTRGQGRSDLGEGVLSFEAISQDILALLTDQDIEKITIIGYSDGGNIALYFASHYPERVAGLVTMGANYEVDALEETAYQEILMHRKNLLLKDFDSQTRRQLQVVNLMLDQLDLKEEDISSIQVPVLVMAGEYDLIKKEHTEKMARLIPNSEVLIVPEGGHDFFLTHPRYFREAVYLFFKKIKYI